MEGEETESSTRISPHAPLRCAEIHNPLSSFPHPGSFPSIHNSEHQSSLPLFSLKLHCFLSQTKWFLLRCDALLLHPGGRNSTDCFFFCLFTLWFEHLQWPRDVTDRAFPLQINIRRWPHPFLMAVCLGCRDSPGQMISLSLSPTALIPLASGYSWACRKKSPAHHWTRADSPAPSPPLK